MVTRPSKLVSHRMAVSRHTVGSLVMGVIQPMEAIAGVTVITAVIPNIILALARRVLALPLPRPSWNLFAPVDQGIDRDRMQLVAKKLS